MPPGGRERAGRVGQTYGTMVKRICTIGWAFTGLIVAALVVQQRAYLPDKEGAFGYACLRLLGPGWVGLMVSCVVAANMSACSNLTVNAGALFTRNIYKEYLNPAASDRALLMTGRLSGLGSTLAGVGFALLIDQVLQAFLFTETIAAFFGIMVVGGLLWRRANRFGAAAAVICRLCRLLRLELPVRRPLATGLRVAGRHLRLGHGGRLRVADCCEPAHQGGDPAADRAVLRQHAALDRFRGPARRPSQAAGRRARPGPLDVGPSRLVSPPGGGKASSAATARTWWGSRSPGAWWRCWCWRPGG